MAVLETTIHQVAAETGEDLFERVYVAAFPIFARFAASRNASLDDAKDVFHDAMVIFYEKTRDEAFRITVSPESYVIGIAKHLWIRKFHADRTQIHLSDMESSIAIPSDFYPTVNERRLLQFVENAGRKCMELLRQFYYDKVSLREIATSLGYRSERSAAVQKFKCIDRMRETVKSKDIGYEDFLQ